MADNNDYGLATLKNALELIVNPKPYIRDARLAEILCGNAGFLRSIAAAALTEYERLQERNDEG